MYKIIIHLIPKRVKSHLYTLFDYSRIKADKEKFLLYFILISLLSSLITSLLISVIFSISYIITFLIVLVILNLAFYFSFSLKADANSKFMESVLPDALQLMSSNLRAGMTTDEALLMSARPEFGIFSEEINNIGKEVALGEDMGEVLMATTEKFRSDKLKKTFSLIASGMRSGGQLTRLLDQTAQNLRKEKFLDEKIRTNVLMYVIFIFVAIAIGAPILFGLSTFLVSVLETNLNLIAAPETTYIPVTFSQISISTHFVLMFAIISLVTTSILGSLVLGLINKGREKDGIKFIPVLIVFTLGIFFLTRVLIGSLLGGLFGLQ